MKTFIVPILFFILCGVIFPQQFHLEGKVFGEKKSNPLSFVNVRVLNSMYGTTTNSEGKYQLKLKAGNYKLVASFIGYISDTISLNVNKNFSEVDFYLKPTSLHTEEVVVLPGKNPALEIIRKAIEKKNSRIAKINSYEFLAYTKGVIRSDQDMNAGDNSVSLGLGRSSDTSKLNIQGILENQSHGFFKKPDYYKEFIIAQKQSSNFPASVNTLTGGRIIQNFYSNDIKFFNRPLTSPLADNALKYYYYYIYDTLAIDKEKVFQIYFEPDYKSDPGFTGYLFITDSTFNLIKVDVELNRAANVGGIFEKVNIFQQFVPYGDDIYMPIDYRLFIKANVLGLVRIGLEVNTILYDYKINSEITDNFFDKAILTVETGADKKDSTYWKNSLTIPTTDEELKAYKAIDSIKSIPKSFWDNFPGNLLSTQINLNDNFSISGPLSFYHFNRVEGHALDFGFYSSQLFDKRFNSNLNFNYGFSDKKFKTDLAASYLLGDYRTYKLSFNAFNKMAVLFPESDEYNDLTSTVLALFSKYEFRNYYYTKGIDFKISGEVFPILNLGLGFIAHKDDSAQVNTNYSFFRKDKKWKDNQKIYNTNINAVTFSFGLDFRNFIEDGYFRRRVSQGNSYIKIGGDVLISDSKTLKSDMDFKKYSLTIDGTLNTFNSAKFVFKYFTNYSYGPVPSQMMYALPGNIDIVSKNWTFRTVGVGEYFGDRVTTLFIEHQFGDELFRLLRIPTIEDLELQLTGFFNVGWIDVSSESKNILPSVNKSFIKPLMEAGFSIGHVLFPLRLEFTWRLNYTEKNKFVIGLNTFIF
ncbi:MAG: DUF5686 family protein [Ignavibacteriales bacterium]|nr:DUF5686 family protein [Ignavibacteriales bacterium]